jgi:hypothetical protein
MLVHATKSVDLVGSWTKFWDVVSGAITGPVQTTITVIGVGLILFSIVKFLWDKRRGQGGKASPIWWTLIFGGVLIAPEVLLPLLLSILQWAINLGLKVIAPVWG